MTQYTTPMGGSLTWAYQPFTYNGGIKVREVTSRSMNDAAASLTNSWTFTHPASDSSLTYHSSTDLLDSGAGSHKVYGTGIPLTGTSLVVPISYQEENPGGAVVLLQKSFTWAQNAAGSPYVGTVISTLSPGTGSSVTSKTVQTLDIYGNLTQQQLYDYPDNPVQSNNSAPFRTYNLTYLTDPNYTSRYIRNRMTSAVVSGPGGGATLATNTYDGMNVGPLLDPTRDNGVGLPGLQAASPLHDTSYGVSFTYRGNPTATYQNGTTANYAYVDTGVPYKMQDGAGMVVMVSTDSSTSYSLPSIMTPNSNGDLATSMTYSSSFALTSVTGANGATQSTTYDFYNRPNTATAVDGAVTSYTYTYLPNTQTATIGTTANGTTTTQWKRNTFDGFGRTIRVETGHDGVTVTAADTRYGPCGCSPLGKTTAVSMPYAPGATVYWTTYTYDGSGRTLTETKPDGSVTTTYYASNAVMTTDPAGKWKIYYSDMAGGLTTVVEPDPNNANPSSNPVTYYYLNGAGQITTVSVQRGGFAQNRTYAWSGSDLASSTEPETGTTTYVYDGNHHVTGRTDANGQQTKYTYDAYERLTEVQHYAAPTCQYCTPQEQLNQQVLYTYDMNPLDPGNYVNSWGRLTGVSFQQQTFVNDHFAYYYSYNQAGRVTTNTFQAYSDSAQLVSLAAAYAWDNQGRMTNMTYPSGTALAYQYDAMGRLSGMTQNGSAIATAGYTAVGQLSSLQYNTFTESRTYNNLMQMTHLTNGGVDMQYLYPAGQNNGRVSQTIDGVLGETVNYTYDMWNRLTSATATNGSWGEQYTFDNFGNLTGKTPTVGSAPALSVAAHTATNRPAGTSFDANGNPQGTSNAPGIPAYVWDVENRLVTMQPAVNSPTNYSYDPWGRRMWKENPGGGRDGNGNPLTTCEFYFYGVTGQKLETYSCSYENIPLDFSTTLEGINLYFGGKLLQSKGVWVATDRLGSVRANSNGERMSYFPYGEERTSTADGREKFGTYTRDGIGQDYAMARYYNASLGAFWSPDPGGIGTAKSKNPTTWNRYAYVNGDPVNHTDRRGLFVDAEDCVDNPDECSNCLPGSSFWGEAPGCDDDGGGGGDAGGGDDNDTGPDCNQLLTNDISEYLGSYDGGNSPLDTSPYIEALVTAGMNYNVDPRFIVSLAVAESQAGINLTWGPFNAWNIRARNPTYKGKGKKPPYTSWGQAIDAVTDLIAGKQYFGAGLTTTGTIYPIYQGPAFETGLKNLNTALGQMHGDQNQLTDPCNGTNLRSPNQ